MSVIMKSLEQPYPWKDLYFKVLSPFTITLYPEFDLVLHHCSGEANTVILNRIFLNIFAMTRQMLNGQTFVKYHHTSLDLGVNFNSESRSPWFTKTHTDNSVSRLACKET